MIQQLKLQEASGNIKSKNKIVQDPILYLSLE